MFSSRKVALGLLVSAIGVTALVRFLNQDPSPVFVATQDSAAERETSRDVFIPGTNASALPENAVAGETILFFKTSADYERFLFNLKRKGLSPLGVIPALNAVRVSTGKSFDFSGVVSQAIGDFNFSVRVPSVGETIPPEARENVPGGGVPVGNSALALMQVSSENFNASAAGNGVKIAVLDTGIFAEHAVFDGVKISRIDVAGGAPDNAESMAHGTAVASLIAGNGNGEIFGLASDAELLSVRVFDGEGNATAFSLAQGIVAAVDAGADIINLSAGLTADAAVLRAAVEYAKNAGVVLVAAAGNEGVKSLSFPAAYAGVIAVGAVDGAGASAAFSNVGENLAVVAPGVAVYAAGTSTGESIVDFSGTSASAPLVAGALAAALSDSAENFDAQKLLETADDFGAPGYDEIYGAGIVNFERLTRLPGASVVDVTVNDFYVSAASGGKSEADLIATMQNRGTLWEACTFSLRITFADGTFTVSNGNLNLRPGESVGQSLQIPEQHLNSGVRIDAEIRDASGKTISGKSAFMKRKSAE